MGCFYAGYKRNNVQNSSPSLESLWRWNYEGIPQRKKCQIKTNGRWLYAIKFENSYEFLQKTERTKEFGLLYKIPNLPSTQFAHVDSHLVVNKSIFVGAFSYLWCWSGWILLKRNFCSRKNPWSNVQCLSNSGKQNISLNHYENKFTKNFRPTR